MRCLLSLAGALLLLGPLLAQGEPPKKDQGTPSVAEQFQAINREIAAKSQELQKKFQEAKEDAERQKIRDEFMAFRQAQIDKAVALAKQHPKEPAAFTMLMQAATGGNNDAIALLAEHHLDNPQIGMVCMRLGQSGSPAAEKLLRSVAEKGKTDDTKAMALLGLAQWLKERAGGDDVKQDEAQKLNAEAEKTFETVAKQYATVKVGRSTAGEMAEKELFDLRHLAVGKPAPDINGPDLDGKEFKLSDYRGKVILLDFWAHW